LLRFVGEVERRRCPGTEIPTEIDFPSLAYVLRHVASNVLLAAWCFYAIATELAVPELVPLVARDKAVEVACRRRRNCVEMQTAVFVELLPARPLDAAVPSL
jgi:hypothetical protein